MKKRRNKKIINEINVKEEIKKLVQTTKAISNLGQPKVKRTMSPDIAIRITTGSRLQKFRALQAKIESFNENPNKKEQMTLNEELNKAIEMYIDGTLAKDFYDLNFKGIYDSINQVIFTRNNSVINYMEKMLVTIMHQLSFADMKLNLLINSTIKDEKTINEFNYLKIRNLAWMDEIYSELLKQTERTWTRRGARQAKLQNDEPNDIKEKIN